MPRRLKCAGFEGHMHGNLHLHKTEPSVSSGLVHDEEKRPFQDELLNTQNVGSTKLVSDQIHVHNGHTDLTSELLPHMKSCPSKAYDISGCSGMEPSEPPVHNETIEPLMNMADNEPVSQGQCSSLEPDEATGGESAPNDPTVLYFCLTCSLGNISAEGLSKHPQCVVMVQKKMLKTNDHSYTKKKQRVMNYVLTQNKTSIYIKCFMNIANQPEAFLCSLCCSDKQMLISEACEHVKILSDSVLLCGQGESQQVLESEDSSPRKKTRYMCVVCGKLYTKQSALGIHMKGHTVEPSSCSHCSKVFMSQAMLNAHLNIHGVFPYKCSQCSKAFLLEPLLNKHLAREHNTLPRLKSHKKTKTCVAPFKCKNCVEAFTTKSELDVHLKTHNYLCSVCGKNFRTLSALKSHDKSHSAKNSNSHVVCDICGLEVYDMRSLNKHVIRQHGENANKSYVCETCGAAFWEKTELAMHQTIHSEERPFSCDLCDATFKRRNYLCSHLESVHNKVIGSLLDPCITCGMKFKTKKEKGEHLKMHSSTLHTCNICNKNLFSKTGLYLHQKYTHEGNKDSRTGNVALKSVLRRAKQDRINVSEGPPFSCSMCEKSYNSKAGVYQHRRQVHFRVNQGKEHPCKVCGKVYNNVFSLYSHKNVHVKKELTCHICSKVFLYQASFHQHLLTHSGVKKHHCLYCDKRFHRKFLLDSHTRTHTGEKPYACDLCGRAFAQLGDRNRHRMRHV